MKLKGWSALDHSIDYLFSTASAALFFAMLFVCVDVFMRNAFNEPLTWVLEICGYIIVYITFIGAVYAGKGESHIRMDIVLKRLSPRAQNVINIVTNSVSAAACLLLTVYSVQVTWYVWQADRLVYGGRLGLPSFPFHGLITLSLFLLGVLFARTAFRYVRSFPGSASSLNSPKG